MRRRLLTALLPALLLAAGARAAELAQVRSLVSELHPLVGSAVEQCLEIEYSSLPREPARIDWPLPEGFLVSDLPPRPMRRITLQGEPRLLESACRRLVPLSAGDLRLPAARISRGSRLLTGGEQTLAVRPLPVSGRPDGFSGAVGSVELNLERSTAADGTPSWDLILTGDGPLDLFPLPEITPATRALQVVLDHTQRQVDGHQERRLRYRPASGELPAATLFALTLFDPQTGSYRRLQAGLPAPPSGIPVTLALGLLAVAGAAFVQLRRWRRRSPEQLLAAWAGIHPNTLDRPAILQQLQRSGLAPDLLDELRRYLVAGRAATFAPARHPDQAPQSSQVKAPNGRKLRKAIDKLGPYRR